MNIQTNFFYNNHVLQVRSCNTCSLRPISSIFWCSIIDIHVTCTNQLIISVFTFFISAGQRNSNDTSNTEPWEKSHKFPDFIHYRTSLWQPLDKKTAIIIVWYRVAIKNKCCTWYGRHILNQYLFLEPWCHFILSQPCGQRTYSILNSIMNISIW